MFCSKNFLIKTIVKKLQYLFVFIILTTSPLFAVNPNNPNAGIDFFQFGAFAWEVDTGTTRIIKAANADMFANTITPSVTLSDPTLYSFGPQVGVTDSKGAVAAWISINKTTGQRFLHASIYSGGVWTSNGQISSNTEDVLPDFTLKPSLNVYPITIVYRAIDLNTNQVVLRNLEGQYPPGGGWITYNIYP